MDLLCAAEEASLNNNLFEANFFNNSKPPFKDIDAYPMVLPTTMPHNFPYSYTVNPISPKTDASGLRVLEIPDKQRMPLPYVSPEFPPPFPNLKHQPSHHNDIFVKPNLQYIDQELHPLYVQTQNMIADLHKERMKRVEEDNNRQMSMAEMELEQRKRRDQIESKYRIEIEDMDKKFNQISDDNVKKLLEMWQRRFAEEKKIWKETMERMHEREKYLTVNDEVLLSDNIAHKLNSQVLLDIGELDQNIYTKENEIQDELNRLKNESINADREYIDIMDEIDRCKEQLRQQRYNTDIRHKYIYQNLMSDKIDFVNKNPNIKIKLPPRKTLGGNPYYSEGEVNTKDLNYFEKPSKYDYDFGFLVDRGHRDKLDAATLPLGKHLEMGVDPSRELDRLDRQLFEWTVKQEATKIEDDEMDKAYFKSRLIPHEYKNRNDLKTDYLM